jgi:hypothetical protein
VSSSLGKRQREQQKLERARAKTERRAARQLSEAELIGEPSPRSEAELVEDLGALHRAFEAGDVSLEDLEARRDGIQAQLERLLR